MTYKHPVRRKITGFAMLYIVAVVIFASVRDESGLTAVLFTLYWPLWLYFLVAGTKKVLPKRYDDAVEAWLPKDRKKMKLYFLAALLVLWALTFIFDLRILFFLEWLYND